jgi:hypothetical protein
MGIAQHHETFRQSVWESAVSVSIISSYSVGPLERAGLYPFAFPSLYTRNRSSFFWKQVKPSILLDRQKSHKKPTLGRSFPLWTLKLMAPKYKTQLCWDILTRDFEVHEIRAQVCNKNCYLVSCNIMQFGKAWHFGGNVSSAFNVEYCSHMILFGLFLDLIFNPEDSDLWSSIVSGLFWTTQNWNPEGSCG